MVISTYKEYVTLHFYHFRNKLKCICEQKYCTILLLWHKDTQRSWGKQVNCRTGSLFHAEQVVITDMNELCLRGDYATHRRWLPQPQSLICLTQARWGCLNQPSTTQAPQIHKKFSGYLHKDVKLSCDMYHAILSNFYAFTMTVHVLLPWAPLFSFTPSVSSALVPFGLVSSLHWLRLHGRIRST